MKTGQLLRALAAAAVGLAGLSANAQDYPSKDITLVVPYSAGGATDGYTRAFAEFLEKRKNLSPVVENRDGAGGTVGTESLRNSDPDGYTISYLSSSTLLSYAFLGREVTLGEDLDSAGGINETATIWVVNPAVIDVTTMDDLIAYLKANPGTSYASVGVGSTAHLTMIDFAARQGLEVEHIPYRGGAAAMGGLLSGEIGLVAGADPGSALPHIKEGTITALAIARAGAEPPGARRAHHRRNGLSRYPDDFLRRLRGSPRHAGRREGNHQRLGARSHPGP